MHICRHCSKSPVTLTLLLLCVALPAFAQSSGLVGLAFTPFSAGLFGGVITGLFASSSHWNKFGPFIWFTCWVLLYTSIFAFHAERPLDAIPTALGISGLWGIISFALTFSIGRFITERLRAYIVSHGKH